MSRRCAFPSRIETEVIGFSTPWRGARSRRFRSAGSVLVAVLATLVSCTAWASPQRIATRISRAEPHRAVAHAVSTTTTTARPGKFAAASVVAASSEAQYVMDWVRLSNDNAGMPYIIIDKVNARVFVLGAAGQIAAPHRDIGGWGRGARGCAWGRCRGGALSAALALLRLDQRGREA